MIQHLSTRLSRLTTHDLIRWAIYALLVLVPSVYSTQFESAFTTPKLLVMRLITLFIVGVWATQIFAQRKFLYRTSPLNKWIAGYAVALVLSTLFSRYILVSLFGEQGRFLGLFTHLNLLFLLGVAMNFFQTKQEIRNALRISVVTAVALAFYGLLQFKGWVGAENWDHDPTLRIFGTFGHSNHFGAYLGMHVLLILGLAWTSKNKMVRIVYAMAALPVLAALLATASRGAFVATAMSAIAFVLLLAGFYRKWLQKNLKSILVTFGIFVLLIGFFYKPILNRFEHLNLTQRTLQTIEFIQAGNVPDRVSWWLSSFEMIQDRPLFGHGLSTFHDIYNLYRRTDYRVPGDEQDLFSPESAHMEYFDIAATQGLFGLFMILGLIFTWIWCMIKILRSEEADWSDKILGAALLTSGGVYYVQLLISFGVVATLIPQYLLVGLSMAFYHLVVDPRPQHTQFRVIPVQGPKAWGGTFILLPLFILSFWFTSRQAAAEFYLKQGQLAEAEKQVAQTLENYEKATDQMPWMVRYWEVYGQAAFQFMYEAPNLELVEQLGNVAIAADQRAYALVETQPHIPANLALVYVAYGDVMEAKGAKVEGQAWREKGIEMYRKALEVAVNNPRFYYTFSKLLLALGREHEAQEAFLETLKIREPYQDSYYQIALIETNFKNYESARNFVQKALQQDPSDERVKALLQRINAESGG